MAEDAATWHYFVAFILFLVLGAMSRAPFSTSIPTGCPTSR